MLQSKTPVRLKGVGNGLCVTLNPVDPIDYLRDELGKIFGDLRHLAINARVILDIGEEEGHEKLVEDLGRYLKDSFNVGLVSRSPRKKTGGSSRKHDMERSWNEYRSDVLMLTGRVRSGQKVTARKHLLIMGDVNPGAEVVAGGDILVLGSLRGTAVAGQPEDEGAIVLALDFQPTQVQIAGYLAAGHPASPKRIVEFAYVDNGTIVVEDYIAAAPFGRMPWPEVR